MLFDWTKHSIATGGGLPVWTPADVAYLQSELDRLKEEDDGFEYMRLYYKTDVSRSERNKLQRREKIPKNLRKGIPNPKYERMVETAKNIIVRATPLRNDQYYKDLVATLVEKAKQEKENFLLYNDMLRPPDLKQSGWKPKVPGRITKEELEQAYTNTGPFQTFSIQRVEQGDMGKKVKSNNPNWTKLQEQVLWNKAIYSPVIGAGLLMKKGLLDPKGEKLVTALKIIGDARTSSSDTVNSGNRATGRVKRRGRTMGAGEGAPASEGPPPPPAVLAQGAPGAAGQAPARSLTSFVNDPDDFFYNLSQAAGGAAGGAAGAVAGVADGVADGATSILSAFADGTVDGSVANGQFGLSVDDAFAPDDSGATNIFGDLLDIGDDVVDAAGNAVGNAVGVVAGAANAIDLGALSPVNDPYAYYYRPRRT